MSEKMYLHAEMDMVGSKCTTDLDCTKREWDEMTADEQEDLINENLGNIVNTWVDSDER
jgi:hypothetical protein